VIAASRPDILIAGGDQDPNLTALAEACARNGMVVQTLLTGRHRRPCLHWDFELNELSIGGLGLAPRAAFIRHDVFADLEAPDPSVRSSALAWFSTLAAYLQLAGVHMPNRANVFNASNKIVALDHARTAGLQIPRTWISNDQLWISEFAHNAPAIAKPVNGGCYTRVLDELIESTEHREHSYAAPAFVQARLSYPEFRVFVIGGETIAFQIHSEMIDYRSNKNAQVVLLTSVPPNTRGPLLSLCRTLGLEFAAADFKSDPETGEPVFMEINDSPMFAAFDRVSGGLICETLVRWLCRSAQPYVRQDDVAP